MGCGYSLKFEPNDFLAGQGQDAVRLFEQLHLSPRDVDLFYTAFMDMCSSSKEVISRDDFNAYFHLEANLITARMVEMLETEEHGKLNFCEMVGVLWDFLSRDPHALGSFAFYIFDKNRNGVLSRNEVTELVEVMQRTTAAKHKKIIRIIDDMCGDSYQIDIKAFHKYCMTHEEVCLMLLGLQNVLREGILGKRFWEDITRKRCASPEQMEADYIIQRFSDKVKEEEDRVRRENLALELRRKKLRLDVAHRDNDVRERKRTNFLYNKLFGVKDSGEKKSHKHKSSNRRRIIRQMSSFGAEPVLVHKKHQGAPAHELRQSTKKPSGSTKEKSHIDNNYTSTSTTSSTKTTSSKACTKVYAFDDDTETVDDINDDRGAYKVKIRSKASVAVHHDRYQKPRKKNKKIVRAMSNLDILDDV